MCALHNSCSKEITQSVKTAEAIFLNATKFAYQKTFTLGKASSLTPYMPRIPSPL